MNCPSTSAQAYENCGAPPQGLYSYPGGFTSPNLDGQYAIVAKRNTPPGAPSSFAMVCEACLRARGLIYWKSTPGDCPKPTASTGIGGGQVVGLSGQAAAGVLGGVGALAIPGVGPALSVAVAGLTELFTHHTQAVQTEQSTICAVAGYFNPLLRQIDAAVKAGTITDQEGIKYVQQFANQAIAGLQSIYKPCNAACVYQAILRAHADFVGYFYPVLSPLDQLTANRPGQAPSTINAPGSVIDAHGVPPLRSTSDPSFAYQPAILNSSPLLTPNSVLPSGCMVCSDYLNLGYNQQTGQSGGYADAPPTVGTNWVKWGAIAAIIAAIVAVVAVSR